MHDPQHRPIAGAQVMVKSATSSWSEETQTNSDGEFTFAAVAFGEYTVSAKASGFAELQQSLTLASDTSAVLHLQLSIASVSADRRRYFRGRNLRPGNVYADHARVSRRHRAHARRRPHQQPRDDHGFHARRLSDARHAAHARRPPDFVAHRRRSHSRHEHRHEPRPARRSRGHRLRRDSARQLRRPVRRPHLRHVQHPPEVGLRHEQRSRTHHHRRQLLSNRRSAQLRRPHAAVCVLRQRQRKPQQSRARNARSAGLSRRRERLRRVQLR